MSSALKPPASAIATPISTGHSRVRGVQEARQRSRVDELAGVVGGQNQRRSPGHRQTDHGVAGRADALVGREPARELRCQEGLPLVGLRGAVAHRGPVPVGVEAGHAAHRHHHRQPGPVEPAERAGLDVPAVSVVPRPQPVQQIHRTRAAALELNLDVATHRRRRHTQHFGCCGRRRRATEDADQAC